MCIIISKVSSAQHPTDEVIEQCWKRNPDGAGIAYASDDGGVSVVKGLMTLEALFEALKIVRAVATSMYVVHFRIGTHGTKDETNTHPFWVKDGKMAIAHNGILPFTSMLNTNSLVSDTNGFVEEVLKKLPEGWEDNPVWAHVIEEYMGAGNKIAIITNASIKLLNERAWNTDKATGLTYSNTSWKPVVYANTMYNLPPYTPPNNSYYNKPIQGTFIPGVKKPKPRRSKDIGICHKRMLSMIKQGVMTDANRYDVGALFRDMVADPEEAEEMLDFVQEAIKAQPDKLHTLEEVQTSVGRTSVLGLIDYVAEIRSKAVQEELQDLESLTFSEENTGYNQENCQCFVGNLVRITTEAVKKEEKLVTVKSLTGYGMHYVTVEGTSGFMAYTYIDVLESLQRYARPNRIEAEDLVGCTVFVEASGNPYTAVLNAVKLNEEYVPVIYLCLGTGVIIEEQLIDIKNLYLLAEPVKLLEAGGAANA